MGNIVGFYQFHEIDPETKKLKCIYCIMEEKDGKIHPRYLDDYEEAKDELRRFAIVNGHKTRESLLSDENLGLQLSNKAMRKKKKKKYNLDTKDIENFYFKMKESNFYS